jgi:hypothetical protein
VCYLGGVHVGREGAGTHKRYGVGIEHLRCSAIIPAA